MEKIYDVMVIGAGPAGCTAALYAARAGLKVLVLERTYPGGQVALTHWVDNYPGFPTGAAGFDLGEAMGQGAKRFGAEFVTAAVWKAELHSSPKLVETDRGQFLGKTVVLATGADPKKLGLPGEEALLGRGLSYCAHCDAAFFRGKTVAVVGGGNSAVGDAQILSRVAEKVYLIHRRDTLRAEQAAVAALNSVDFLWNSQVTALHRADNLTGITVKNSITGAETRLSCQGLFVSIGRSPASRIARGQLILDQKGYISAGEDTQTGVPGVYAAGDVRTKGLRQIVTATADGAMAAHQAEQYLAAL